MLKIDQEKNIQITSILLGLFIFFIPISPSIKSVIFVLVLGSIFLNPLYRSAIKYTVTTYWGLSALLLFFWIVFACFWSPASVSLQMTLVEKYSKLLYLPILAVAFVQPGTRFLGVHAFLAAMVVTCCTAILKVYGLIHINDPLDPGALFFSHIITGFMMSMACYIAALYACDTEGKRRWLYIAIVFLTSYQILFLNTGRTGYVIYALLLFLFLIQKLSIKKALLSGVACLGLFVLAYQASPVLHERVNEIIQDAVSSQKHQELNSVGFRLMFHDYAKEMFKQHPWIGIGTGGFQYTYAHEKPSFTEFWGPVLTDPHSQYWMILAEQGVVGAVLLFVFLASLFYAAFQLKENRSLLLGILTAFCVGSLSDSILCYSTIGYLLIVLSALCLGQLLPKAKALQ
ncbi:MAG: O-antigen biosynthesis protein [Legionella sp.]|nr:MAG: O-antigen biosynthesis protein [Legionella sp.]PJD99774.1 MAG: O-antigen biosynthesis protein [Legionella sp.]